VSWRSSESKRGGKGKEGKEGEAAEARGSFWKAGNGTAKRQYLCSTTKRDNQTSKILLLTAAQPIDTITNSNKQYIY